MITLFHTSKYKKRIEQWQKRTENKWQWIKYWLPIITIHTFFLSFFLSFFLLFVYFFLIIPRRLQQNLCQRGDDMLTWALSCSLYERGKGAIFFAMAIIFAWQERHKHVTFLRKYIFRFVWLDHSLGTKEKKCLKNCATSVDKLKSIIDLNLDLAAA